MTGSFRDSFLPEKICRNVLVFLFLLMMPSHGDLEGLLVPLQDLRDTFIPDLRRHYKGFSPIVLGVMFVYLEGYVEGLVPYPE